MSDDPLVMDGFPPPPEQIGPAFLKWWDWMPWTKSAMLDQRLLAEQAFAAGWRAHVNAGDAERDRLRAEVARVIEDWYDGTPDFVNDDQHIWRLKQMVLAALSRPQPAREP